MIPVHKSDENLESDENLGSIDSPCNVVLAFSQSKIKSLLTLNPSIGVFTIENQIFTNPTLTLTLKLLEN